MSRAAFPRSTPRRFTGSPELRFVPAKLRGEPIAVSILFPVYFRHPERARFPATAVLQSDAAPVTGRTAT